MATDPERRERALVLLKNHHRFPGTFEFRAVIRPEARSAVIGAVLSSLSTPEPLRGLSERPSRQGKYVSVRIAVTVASAEEVLEIYDVLKLVDGVLTTM